MFPSRPFGGLPSRSFRASGTKMATISKATNTSKTMNFVTWRPKTFGNSTTPNGHSNAVASLTCSTSLAGSGSMSAGYTCWSCGRDRRVSIVNVMG